MSEIREHAVENEDGTVTFETMIVETGEEQREPGD